MLNNWVAFLCLIHSKKKIYLKQQGINGQLTLTKIHLVSTRFNLI